MKKSALVPALLISLASPAFASVALGTNAELFFTGDIAVSQDSNLFLTNTAETSDLITTVTPGLLVSIGKGVNRGVLSLTETFQFFSKESDLNDELFTGAFGGQIARGNATITSSASFKQVNTPDRDTAGFASIARRDISNAASNINYLASAKSVIGFGVSWNDTLYTQAGTSDRTFIDVPLKYYHQTTPILDLTAGIKYRDNQLETAGLDSTEMFYSVGAKGVLVPDKFDLDLNIGYKVIDPDTGTKETGVGIVSNFHYGFTEKTDLDLDVTSDFGYGSGGAAYDSKGAMLAFETRPSAQLTVKAFYSLYNYAYLGSSREDEFTNLGVNGEYAVNAFLRLKGAISHGKNDSSVTGSGFKVTKYTFTAMLKY